MPDQVGLSQWNDKVKVNVRTTIPTTGLTKGELMLLFHGDTPKLAICISTLSQKISFVNLKRASLIGALSF